jgi:DNA polymerase-3 subunit gamma/tau
MSMAAVGGGRASAAPRREPAPNMSAPPAPRLEKLEDVVALAAEKRDLQIKLAIERFVRPVSMQEGRIEISLAEGAPVGFANNLSAKLHEWSGKRWVVVLSSQPGGETLEERRKQIDSVRQEDARNHPLVQAVLQRFPGSKIVDVRQRSDAAEVMPGQTDFDGPPDMPPDPPDDDRLD